MNYSSLTMGLWDKITDFFNIIPKLIYFLFASVTAAVDAMQSLVKKLAGLDTYYTGGEAVKDKDPLTEFVFGILGFGESSATYKALNTVFWSLAIFGVIVLVIATIIAIVKSHYNEDTAGTSPWKYIYTAIKAIFTFAIVPFAVVIGMNLSTFLLKTLNQITAGSGNVGEIRSMYGSDAADLFVTEVVDDSTGQKTCIHYDIFGVHTPSNSSTFSGMLFSSATYSANRARKGTLPISKISQITSNGKSIFANSSCTNYTSATSEADKQEYVAQQIDYAFENCLVLNEGFSYSEMSNTFAGSVTVNGLSDFWGAGKTNVDTFSKFDISIIWAFYDLWSWNPIVGFAGAFSACAIMLSIITGMMSRLIKGTALFLIYPSLLGLAPMDNFKAFKDWSKQFMSCIIMAVGSIVGFNVMLLILPYMQNIVFFNVPIIDYIINVIVLIVGLMMVKDFMGIVAGLVGGDEASKAGEGYKGQLGANIKKGAGITAKAGLGMAKATATVMATPVGAFRRATSAGKANKSRIETKTAKNSMEKAEQELNKSRDSGRSYIQTALNGGNSKITSEQKDILNQAKTDGEDKFDKEHKQEYIDAKGNFISENQKKKYIAAKEAAGQDAAIEKAREINLGKTDSEFNEKYKDIKSNQETVSKAQQEYGEKKAKEDAIKEKYKLYQDEDGKYGEEGKYYRSEGTAGAKGFIKKTGAVLKGDASSIKQGITGGAKMVGGVVGNAIDSASFKEAGKVLADTFLKSVDEASQGLGLDKGIKGTKDILGTSLTFKGGVFDTKPDLSGDKLAKDSTKKTTEAIDNSSKKQTEAIEKLTKIIQEGNNENAKGFQGLKNSIDTINNKSSGSGDSNK